MHKEELIGKLQMVYVGDKNALNELIGYYDGLKQVIEELQQENKQLKQQFDKYKKKITPLKMLQQLEVLEQENKELKEDISFCLHSIKQEMEMSTDSRTRNEMTSCYEILKRWNK